MITIEDSFLIRRTLDDVFAYTGAMEHLPEWARGVISVTREAAGPVHAGTVFRVTGRMAGRTVRVSYTITALEPNASFSAAGRCPGFALDETFRFRPVDGGTEVRLVTLLHPVGVLQLVDWILGKVLGNQIRADNRRLKRRLESQR